MENRITLKEVTSIGDVDHESSVTYEWCGDADYTVLAYLSAILHPESAINYESDD